VDNLKFREVRENLLSMGRLLKFSLVVSLGDLESWTIQDSGNCERIFLVTEDPHLGFVTVQVFFLDGCLILNVYYCWVV
jgi:hypothetical protein